MLNLASDSSFLNDEDIIEIAPYDVPESLTFAYPTRLADSWMALPECIVQRAMQTGPTKLHINLYTGSTSDQDGRKRSRNPLTEYKRKQVIDRRGDYIFDARYEANSNVGHYIVDTIPKILLARRVLSERLAQDIRIDAVLKDGASRMSLELFAAFGIATLCTEAQVVGNLITATSKPTETHMGGRLLHANAPALTGCLADLYTDYRKHLVSGAERTPDKIYISRRDSRTIENEDEVVRFLEERGYRKYLFESGELEVFDQWRVVAGASHIVAIHGAGLTPLIFNQRGFARARGDLSGLRVVELHGPGYYVDYNRRLAAITNAHWCGVRGRITPQVVRDLDERGGGRVHQSSPFQLDLGTLELALAYSDRCGSAPINGSL